MDSSTICTLVWVLLHPLARGWIPLRWQIQLHWKNGKTYKRTHISSWNVIGKHVKQFVPGRFHTSTYFKLNIWICFRGSVWKFGSCFRDFLLRKNLFNFSFALGVLSFLRGLFPWALGFMESRSLCTLLTAKEGTKRWIIDHFNVPISRCVLVWRRGGGGYLWLLEGKVNLKVLFFLFAVHTEHKTPSS